eukprot:scaffold30862_cov22-Tisochrysis_lutea.AAC.1
MRLSTIAERLQGDTASSDFRATTGLTGGRQPSPHGQGHSQQQKVLYPVMLITGPTGGKLSSPQVDRGHSQQHKGT